MAQPIILTEGDEVTYTITAKRAGSAINLTGYTVVLYAKDDDAAEGTNQVNGASVTVTDAANGVCSFSFTATHSALPTGKTMLTGLWALKLTTGGNDEYTKQEPFLIHKNPFIA